MKFKVGDKVRLKTGLKVNESYGCIKLLKEMVFEGVLTVKSVCWDDTLSLDSAEFPFYYSFEMLELVDSDTPKYKVGDKVRVRSDLTNGKRYYMENSERGDIATNDMVSFAGKVVTIKDASMFGYHLEEDTWHWTDEMFEGFAEETPIPVPDEEKPVKLKVGQRVKIRTDLESDKCYGEKYDLHCYCTDTMLEHGGEFVHIKEIHGSKGLLYTIEEHLSGCMDAWEWSFDMFEIIEEDPLDMLIEINLPIIPTKPIVVLPIISDSFTKAWMESFVKRNGGMAVESN